MPFSRKGKSHRTHHVRLWAPTAGRSYIHVFSHFYSFPSLLLIPRSGEGLLGYFAVNALEAPTGPPNPPPQVTAPQCPAPLPSPPFVLSDLRGRSRRLPEGQGSLSWESATTPASRCYLGTAGYRARRRLADPVFRAPLAGACWKDPNGGDYSDRAIVFISHPLKVTWKFPSPGP